LYRHAHATTQASPLANNWPTERLVQYDAEDISFSDDAKLLQVFQVDNTHN
jgi:hypothetical protein